MSDLVGNPEDWFSRILAIFSRCTGRFVSDLVGNPEDWFSRIEAYLVAPQFLVVFNKSATMYMIS